MAVTERVEKKINQWLGEGHPLSLIAQKLTQRALNENCSLEDRQSIFSFLINAGYNKTAIVSFAQIFRDCLECPWGHFVHLASQAHQSPPKSVVRATLKGAIKQSLIEQLVKSNAWDKHDDRLPKWRKEQFSKKLQENESLKEELKEKLSFLQGNQLIDEERRFLEKLIKMFPEDEDLKKHQRELEERWSREVISRRASAATERQLFSSTETDLDPQSLNFIQILSDELLHLCENHAHRSYDLAMVSYFMGLYNQTLEVLEAGDPICPARWLHLQCLVEARRFAEALDAIDQLETDYIEEPETTFSCNYLRALALKGLGQTSSAVEILKSIVNVRPNYRSAHSLLSDWSESWSNDECL